MHRPTDELLIIGTLTPCIEAVA